MKPVIQRAHRTPPRSMPCSRLLCRAGRDAPMAKLMLVPEAWQDARRSAPGAQGHVQLLQRRDGAVGRPGRAGDDRRPLGGRGCGPQRLRPLRYTITSDGLLIVGSETGMVVVPEPSVVEKGRMGPGQMIAVDLAEGVSTRRAIKDRIAADRPYGATGQEHHQDRKLSDARRRCEARPLMTARTSRAARFAAGMTLEDMELILSRWWRTRRKRSARWATTRRSRSFRTSRARSATSSARISARSPTRRSTLCANGM
jgi:glutamate synthase (NADPH/NADH) large chain